MERGVVGGLASLVGGIIDADMNTEPNRTQPNPSEPFRSLVFILGTKFHGGGAVRKILRILFRARAAPLCLRRFNNQSQIFDTQFSINFPFAPEAAG